MPQKPCSLRPMNRPGKQRQVSGVSGRRSGGNDPFPGHPDLLLCLYPQECMLLAVL